MSKRFSLLFYLKKAKTDNTGKAPIYCRVTVNGKRSELSIKRSIEASKWSSKKGYVRGTTEEVRSMNVYIDTVRNKLYEYQREVIDKNTVLTAEGLKNMYLGIDECNKTVLEIFEYHNEKIKSQIGKDYSISTHKKFIYTLNHLTAFIQSKYNRSDLFLNEINSEFVNEFDYYLRVTKKCNNNTTVKYVKLFKKIIGLALAHGWLDRDPIPYIPTCKSNLRYSLNHRAFCHKIFSKKVLRKIVDGGYVAYIGVNTHVVCNPSNKTL